MPASRSGVREQAEMEKLVGQQIECRITKLDTANEDVVVDRRVVLEEREKASEGRSVRALRQKASVVRGTVRSLMDFGAFVDLGGVDGLLHVSDMSFARNVKPSDVVSVGDSHRRQDSEDRERLAQDRAGAEAACCPIRGRSRLRSTFKASASRAKFRALRISERSSNWSPALRD